MGATTLIILTIALAIIPGVCASSATTPDDVDLAAGVEEFAISSPDEIEAYVQTAVSQSRSSSSPPSARSSSPSKGVNTLAPGGAMFKTAEESARRRLVYTETPSQFQKKQALIGSMRTSILQLAGETTTTTTTTTKDSDSDDLEDDLEASIQALIANTTAKNATTRSSDSSQQLVAALDLGDRFLATGKLAGEITRGAISQAGALSEEEADPLSSVNILKVPWLAALDMAEREAAADSSTPGTRSRHPINETAFESWYAGAMGGTTEGVLRARDDRESRQTSPLGVLTAEDDLRAGDAVLSMPLKAILCQLSLRSRRLKSGFLADKLKAAFAKNQEWGLAVALLYEVNQHRHGSGSKFAEFLSTLRMRLLGTEVVQSIRGTFAAEMLKIEEDELADAYGWISANVCKTDTSGMCNRRGGTKLSAGVFTREDFRWALSVVKQNAVPLKLATTGREYLALVPFANLALHDPSAGGEMVLGLNNVAELRLGQDVSAFHPIKITKGEFTDAETFLRYHYVSEEENPFNSVRMKIPGGGAASEDIIHKVQTLRDWRKTVGLPPRSADLWRAASQLNLYGEDEEEQEFMDRQNRIISGTNLEPITRAEELMLTGKARTSEEAALMIKPSQAGSDAKGSLLAEPNPFSETQLYTAPDLEEDVSLQMAAKSLKEAAHQLHISVALNQTTEGSVGRVMNETRNFFLYGTAPPRGLDALDQLLIRKAEVMASCGDPRDFVIRAKNVSADLLCAMRVTLLNETEIDLIDNFGFNASEPITRENEALMLTTLTSSIKGLLGMHPTSADEDEALLDAEDLSPKQRQAVLLRKREKELLVSTLDFLRRKTEELGSQDERNETESQGRYQIASLMEEERAKEERLEDLRRKLEEERERMNRTKVEVVTVTVNVRKAGQPGSAESANLTIHEGDSLVSKVAEFGAKHDLDAQGRAKLENHVKNAIAEEKPIAALVQAITRYGAIAVLGAREGDNVTDNVERFLLSQGLLEEGEDKFSDLLQEMERKLRSRVEARLLFQIPIVAPDGRKLGLQIRDGEQHDLPGFMRTFAQYATLPASSVQPLAQEAQRRLAPEILQVPVNLDGSRRLVMRLCGGDEDRLEEVISNFCDKNDIQEESTQHQLKRLVLSKLHPGASLL